MFNKFPLQKSVFNVSSHLLKMQARIATGGGIITAAR